MGTSDSKRLSNLDQLSHEEESEWAKKYPWNVLEGTDAITKEWKITRVGHKG